jgi:hypothetical protein
MDKAQYTLLLVAIYSAPHVNKVIALVLTLLWCVDWVVTKFFLKGD